METLRNAPITEAVLDIRVDFERAPEIQDLEKVYPELKAEYPTKELNSVFQATFGISKGHPQAGFQGQPNGMMFKTQDGRKIVQMRVDGYTFNKLKPYDTWESFREEAETYWKLFVERTSPLKAVRIALRYINRFELPLPISKIGEFLNTGPKIGEEIQHTLDGFFLRFEIAQAGGDTKAIVSVLRDQSQKSTSHYAIILDIDAFQVVDAKPGDEQIWSKFEEIRNFKNEVFFNSVTNETLNFFR